MKKWFAKPLHQLSIVALILAFAWPAAAQETVTNDVYGGSVEEQAPVEPAEEEQLPAPAEFTVKVESGDHEIKIAFAKIGPAESYEIEIMEDGAAFGKAVIRKASIKGDTVTYTAKNLKNNVGYSFKISALKGDDIVGYGNGFGIPARVPVKMPGLKVVAGDGQVTLTFDKLNTKEIPDTYQIHWWTEIDKKTGYPKYLKPVIIKAKDIKGKTYSYTFKKLKNGTTYHFNVFGETTTKDILALSKDLKATPLKAVKKKK